MWMKKKHQKFNYFPILFYLETHQSATDFHLFYRRHQHHRHRISLRIRRWDVFPYGECVFHYEIYNGSLNWLSLNNILDCDGMGFYTSIQNTLLQLPLNHLSSSYSSLLAFIELIFFKKLITALSGKLANYTIYFVRLSFRRNMYAIRIIMNWS